MREFDALPREEKRRFIEHLPLFARKDPNVMHQIKRLEHAGSLKRYRLKVARKYAIVFDWEGNEVTLQGFRSRGDPQCYTR